MIFLQVVGNLLAQDQTLPSGSSHIYLHTGKKIKDVQLWRIDSSKVEYVLHGNLADVETTQVSKIEVSTFLIEFDEANHIVKKEYDLIILTTNDTLRGHINEVGKRTITYIPVGLEKSRVISRTDVKSFNWWKSQNILSSAPMSAVKPTSEQTYSAQLSGGNMLNVSEQVQDSTITIYANDSILESGVANFNQENKSVDKFYYESYSLGVSDAIQDSKTDDSWGAKGFLLGLTFGSPYLSFAAINSSIDTPRPPKMIDQKLYRNGYENETRKLRAQKAATGAATAKTALIIVLLLILIL